MDWAEEISKQNTLADFCEVGSEQGSEGLQLTAFVLLLAMSAFWC
jgi:hypothetical protein